MVGVEPRARAFLVLAHQPAVAGHIGREDRRQPALDPLPFHHVLLGRGIQLAPMPSVDQPRIISDAHAATPLAEPGPTLI